MTSEKEKIIAIIQNYIAISPAIEKMYQLSNSVVSLQTILQKILRDINALSDKEAKP